MRCFAWQLSDKISRLTGWLTIQGMYFQLPCQRYQPVRYRKDSLKSLFQLEKQMSTEGVNNGRRRFLIATTSAVGATGVGFASVPFIKSWMPSAKAQAGGAPVTVNIDALEVGQLLKVQWRGQTIGILRRSEESLALLPEVDDQLRDPDSLESEQPQFAKNEARASRPEFLVVNMHCTHLGCDRKVFAKGLCANHYMEERKRARRGLGTVDRTA